MIPINLFLLGFVTFPTTVAQFLASDPICSTHLNKCYRYSYNRTSFSDAEEQCVNLGGHLTSIHNQEENDYIASIGHMILAETNSNFYWIGGTNSSSGWKWTDGTSFDYSYWALDEPDRGCATQTVENSCWVSYFCEASFPFICSIPQVASSTSPLPVTVKSSSNPIVYSTSYPGRKCAPFCDDGWIYFGFTDSCYKVFHNAIWEEAEETCISYSSHLTSIHSDKENIFVNNLAATGIKGGTSTSLAWIGMHQKSNGEWAWTDGSRADYFKWAPKQPDNPGDELCVQTAPDVDEHSWYEEWNNNACTSDMRAYICKKASNYN